MGIIFGIVFCVLFAAVAPFIITKVIQRGSSDSDFGGRPPKLTEATLKIVNVAVRVIFGGIAIGLVVGTSLIIVGDSQIALLKRVYFATDLPSGRIIGIESQKGKKAETIGPGFHFILGLNVLNDVEKVEMITVSPGHYRTLSARDGKSLPPGVTYAPAFQSQLNTFLEADVFLTTAEKQIGFKGPQATVLLPGTWRVNTYLWDVSDDRKATDIPQGFVGVVKSNALTAVNFGSAMTASFPESGKCVAIEDNSHGVGALSSPLMPVGCIGIWNEVLPPGKYYVNHDVFTVTSVDTRVQAWEYKGGYLSRSVDLSVDAKGEITQEPRSVEVAVPKGAADEAVGIKIEGYTIHQSLRVLVQVTPQNAPFIVASVGGMEEVENRIITPAVQSAVRDLSGQFITVTEAVIDRQTGKPMLDPQGNAVTRESRRPVAPLDLIERRGVLQAVAEEQIKPEGEKAGVTIREVRFLQPDMPPEVLIPRKRQQLAFEMIETLKKEQQAQLERIAKANAEATAEQQPALVEAQQAVKIAEQYKQKQQLRGEADRKYLEQVAAGQEAQADVLGKDLVARLKMMELILDKPEALANLGKVVPNIVVMNGGEKGSGGFGSLEGLAAVLSGGSVMSGNRSGSVTGKPLKSAE
ncbi:MAG: hypothetical protein K9M10_02805 [Candidatus Pacebacteria bacterium]|nr:hypothetical protein [Candidatus Paceibacterota bacterium]